MKRLYVIGIGAGDPEYLTVQAIKVLNRVDVFFVVDKGRAVDDLARLRQAICERYIEDPSSYRIVHIPDPVRDREAPSYRTAVESWRDERSRLYEGVIDRELGEDETGGFLVWGDPSLYDGTMLVLDGILRRGRVKFDYEVIPGISSVSALAARHRVPLNRTGEAIQITTGRRLASAGVPEDVDNVVVMLDSECAFSRIDESDLEIYWGAFLGTDDEILVSGCLDERAATVERVRAAAKEKKGWMFDTYLLRKAEESGNSRE